MRRVVAAVLLASLCAAPAARGEERLAGTIRGRVDLGVAGLSLAVVAPLVVYLESEPGTPSSGAPPRAAVMNQRDARFSPAFLVVAPDQPVRMANDDAIYHNVFSYSRPNDFDLGLYPAGESRTLRLSHPGVVKLYCSIHESMNATILVAPTRWFDTVSGSGDYTLGGVPPGRYRAVVWSERLPATARDIVLDPGETLRLDWVIGTLSASATAR